MEISPISRKACVETSTDVSPSALNFPKTAIGLGSISVGTTNAERSSVFGRQISDSSFFSAALLSSCTTIIDSGKEWLGNIFL